jgi:hypothetical protein
MAAAAGLVPAAWRVLRRLQRVVFCSSAVVQTCAAGWDPPSAFLVDLRLDAGLELALLLRESAEFSLTVRAWSIQLRKGLPS